MNVLGNYRSVVQRWFAFSVMLAANYGYAESVVSLYAESNNPKTVFALDEVKNALMQKGHSVRLRQAQSAEIILCSSTSSVMTKEIIESFRSNDILLTPEGFRIQIDAKNKVWVIGADLAGTMYGGLELAEQIKLYGLHGVRNTLQNPHMKKRGIKFNIPLDVRTPSYSDMSDAGQKNIASVWNFNFWKEMIDHLARNRYNMISLWNLHPFPSMVRVPEYPDIALNDVMRSTVAFADEYSTRATGFDAPEILHHPETVLKISIDEKITFWKRVMQYGKDRNIEFVIVTWNIYTYSINGKYGITDDMKNTVTKDYFRKSVRQMFLTYPDLAGIGITTGENMGKGREGYQEKEDWIFDSYGSGIMDAAKAQPKRMFTFIHREHEAGASYITKKFAPLFNEKNINVVYSFKYAKAHVMSSVRQTYHEKFLREIEGTKTYWTLRNDDNYYFRWGAPDFVRKFITNIPGGASEGFYYGSDGYIWGKDFLSRQSGNPNRLEIERHWYHWMLWGRLGYDSGLSNERLIGILKNHFPSAAADTLFAAWQAASMIYPITTGFHWGALDYQWYIEGCKSRPGPAQTASGFHDVNRFITLLPHPHSGYQSIPEYAAMTDSSASSGLLSPVAVSHMLHRHADSALALLNTMHPGGDKELAMTLSDIESMAYLGKYYAYKIHGAAALALYRVTKNTDHRNNAVALLTHALEFWTKYTSSAMQQYHNPLWTNRVGRVDWSLLTEEVKHDIAIAGE